jgi:glycosyltransferase involved in cell wall biosynthesis
LRNPNISVVIPTHGGRFLTAAAQSVQAQTFVDWELIIVDDGSTDDTAEIAGSLAAEDPRVRVVTNPRNTGIAAARNRGLSSISPSSEYVAFLDHDDAWRPEALETLRAALVANVKASAAHGTATGIDELGATIPIPPQRLRRMGILHGRLAEWPAWRPTEFANLAYENCIVSTGSGLIRRKELVAMEAFDLRAAPSDDYDLWIRLARRGEIAFIDRPVLAYRSHGGQTSFRPPPPRGQGTPYVRYKTITSPDNTEEQRRLAIAGFRARQRRLLRQRWSALETDWRSRDFGELPRHMVDVVARIAAYARGRPWAWHR